jgi:hypothetical protein
MQIWNKREAEMNQDEIIETLDKKHGEVLKALAKLSTEFWEIEKQSERLRLEVNDDDLDMDGEMLMVKMRGEAERSKVLADAYQKWSVILKTEAEGYERIIEKHKKTAGGNGEK